MMMASKTTSDSVSKANKKVLVGLVYVALFLDNNLMTAISNIFLCFHTWILLIYLSFYWFDSILFSVPILPSMLQTYRHDVGFEINRNMTTFSDVVQLKSFGNNSFSSFEIHTEKLSGEKAGRDMGIFLGCKALIQLISNMFIGPITNRYVYDFANFIWN